MKSPEYKTYVDKHTHMNYLDAYIRKSMHAYIHEFCIKGHIIHTYIHIHEYISAHTETFDGVKRTSRHACIYTCIYTCLYIQTCRYSCCWILTLQWSQRASHRSSLLTHGRLTCPRTRGTAHQIWVEQRAVGGQRCWSWRRIQIRKRPKLLRREQASKQGRVNKATHLNKGLSS